MRSIIGIGSIYQRYNCRRICIILIRPKTIYQFLLAYLKDVHKYHRFYSFHESIDVKWQYPEHGYTKIINFESISEFALISKKSYSAE
jgi:hypothetical protein